MTMNIEDKIDLCKYRIEKSKKLISDATKLFDTASYESSVNRSYYAILTAAKALLVLRGIEPETHDGVKTMLSKEFIRTGLLPKEFGETFRGIYARRIDSDYGDYIEIGIDESAESLKRAYEFVEKVEVLAINILKDLSF